MAIFSSNFSMFIYFRPVSSSVFSIFQVKRWRMSCIMRIKIGLPEPFWATVCWATYTREVETTSSLKKWRFPKPVSPFLGSIFRWTMLIFTVGTSEFHVHSMISYDFSALLPEWQIFSGKFLDVLHQEIRKDPPNPLHKLCIVLRQFPQGID